MKIQMLFGMLMFLFITTSVNAQITYTENTVTNCINEHCTKTIYSRPVYVYENEQWQKFTDASVLKWESEGFNFSYNDDYWFILEPFVVYNGIERTFSDIKSSFPDVVLKNHISASFSNHKFSLNLSNVPQNLIDNTDYVGLRLIASYGLTWDDVVKTSDRSIIIKDKIDTIQRFHL